MEVSAEHTGPKKRVAFSAAFCEESGCPTVASAKDGTKAEFPSHSRLMDGYSREKYGNFTGNKRPIPIWATEWWDLMGSHVDVF